MLRTQSLSYTVCLFWGALLPWLFHCRFGHFSYCMHCGGCATTIECKMSNKMNVPFLLARQAGCFAFRNVPYRM